MEELPPSFDDAMEDIGEMQHLSRIAALHTLGALSDVCSSRRKVKFEASGIKKHKTCASTSQFSDHARRLLESTVHQRIWEHKTLPKLTPRGGKSPRNRMPQKRPCIQQLRAPSQHK